MNEYGTVLFASTAAIGFVYQLICAWQQRQQIDELAFRQEMMRHELNLLRQGLYWREDDCEDEECVESMGDEFWESME